MESCYRCTPGKFWETAFYLAPVNMEGCSHTPVRCYVWLGDLAKWANHSSSQQFPIHRRRFQSPKFIRSPTIIDRTWQGLKINLEVLCWTLGPPTSHISSLLHPYFWPQNVCQSVYIGPGPKRLVGFNDTTYKLQALFLLLFLFFFVIFVWRQVIYNEYGAKK